MPTRELVKYKEENNFKEFYEKIKSLVPELERFMTASLKVSENQGKIERQFYDAQGMLDEVYLDVFNTFSPQQTLEDLKHVLFEKSIAKIDEIIKYEEETQSDISTESILKHELNRLQEKFLMDVDGDLILKTELDDISYKQDTQWTTQIILEEDAERQLINKLDLQEASLLSQEKRGLLGSLYGDIPPRSTHILELFVFGEQSVSEISKIMYVGEDKVNKILKIISERFRLI